jgi:hypothetical protein
MTTLEPRDTVSASPPPVQPQIVCRRRVSQIAHNHHIKAGELFSYALRYS